MQLPYTGERFMPGHDGSGIHLEHVHRYAIAATLVRGRVLDLGCGVGYGAQLVARTARRVVALDLSPKAVRYGASKFPAPDLTYLAGDGRTLPFRASSFDWVVCFELIEHIVEGEELLAEIRRVLTPEGQLLLSTPNRPVYSEQPAYTNPFHLREYDRGELDSLLGRLFGEVVLLGQRLVAGSMSWDLEESAASRQLTALPPEPGIEGGRGPMQEPRYLLAWCSAQKGGAERKAAPACESIVTGELETFLEEQEARRRESDAATRGQYEAVIAQLSGQLQEFDTRIRQLGSDIEAHVASSQRQAAALIEDRDRERARRNELEAQLAEASGQLVAATQKARVASSGDLETPIELRYEAVIEELSEQLQQSRMQIHQVATDVEDHLASSRRELAQLTEERDRERARRDDLEEEMRALTLELDRLRQDHASLSENLLRQRANAKSLSSFLAAERSQQAAIRSEAETWKAREAELLERLDRVTRDLDWSYLHWQKREAELEEIHRSRMWRLWMAYIAARHAVLAPVPGLAKARPALLAAVRWSGRLLTRPLGFVFLAAWAGGVWLQAAWRKPLEAAGVDREPGPTPAGRRPRILIVCPYPLCPPDHGGGVRIYNLVRRLSRSCDLQLLLFTQGADDPVQREALSPLVERLHFHHWRPQVRTDPWGLKPLGVQLFEAPEVRDRVTEILSSQRIDILQLEYTEMGQYGMPRYARVKVVLTEIDITFRSRARRRRAGMHNRYRLDRIHGYSLAHWLRQFRYEVQVARRADQVHVMSQEDGAYLARFLPGGWRTIRVVPNAVDLGHYRLAAGDERERHRLLFVGNFEHLPNLDALDYLLDEVWPLVRARVPEAELRVVGARAGPSVLRRHGKDGVEVKGAVPDTRPFYQQCRGLVAPIRAGSGTRLKILEAMACGAPVVSTTLGAEGISGENGVHFLLADSSAALSDAVCRLLTDDALCARLSSAARRLVEERYGWERSANAALAGYRSLLPETSPGGGSAGSEVEPAPSRATKGVNVSVIVPTRNGGAVLERCLAAVRGQETARTVEIVCVDSGSPAADLEAMRRHGARVVEIDPEEFNHGLTRDLGAEESRGEVLVFLNQDAVPSDEHWLERLTAPLFSDDGFVAVQGGILEVPEPDDRFYWDSCGPRFYFTRESKRWMEAYFGIGFSTVNAAIRREAWERHRFGFAEIMEDKKWQREVVEAGGAIAEAPHAVVHHTHRYRMRALVRRCQSEGFGWRTLGERYRLRDMLADMARPGLYADLASGLVRGRVRTWAEVLFPWLRPLMVYRGNRWGRAAKL